MFSWLKRKKVAVEQTAKTVELPICPVCGLPHPLLPIGHVRGARTCCKCGVFPARLPYGWCLDCTEEFQAQWPDDMITQGDIV